MMVALAWVMALTLGPVLLTIMFVGSPPRLEQADPPPARSVRQPGRLDTIEGTVSFDPAGSHTGG